MRIATLSGILCLSLIRVAAGQTLSAEVLKFVKVNAPIVALTHVRLVDGTGAAAAEDQTLVLSAGKIASGQRKYPRRHRSWIWAATP